MKTYVVYRIMNIRNGRYYIGSTGNFEVRKSEHLGFLRSGKHQNGFLQSDFRIYGESAFVFEVIIDGFLTRENMLVKEYELILKGEGNVYNIHTDCPAVSGGNGKSKSIRRRGKIFVGKLINAKKKSKRARPKPIKTEYPIIDEILLRKQRREQNKLNAQSGLNQ